MILIPFDQLYTDFLKHLVAYCHEHFNSTQWHQRSHQYSQNNCKYMIYFHYCPTLKWGQSKRKALPHFYGFYLFPLDTMSFLYISNINTKISWDNFTGTRVLHVLCGPILQRNEHEFHFMVISNGPRFRLSTGPRYVRRKLDIMAEIMGEIKMLISDDYIYIAKPPPLFHWNII
jgi:hypothetical protein